MNEYCGRCANRYTFAVCINCHGASNYAPLEEQEQSGNDCLTCKHKDSAAGAAICKSCTIRGNEPPTNWEQEEMQGLYCLTEDCPYQNGMPCASAGVCGGYEGRT